MAAQMNPCPQCGAPLRWIPEAGFWNCDRCGNRVAPNAAPPTPPPGNYPGHMQQGEPQQQGYPPQQQGYPPQQQGYPPQQQGYPPQGYGHYPQHGAPRKSKAKLIAILAAVAALAAGGIVIAVVMSKKSSDGGGGGGFDSQEALAKATVAALAAGDSDKLLGLMMPMSMINDSVECPEAEQAKMKELNQTGQDAIKKVAADAATLMKGSEATFKSGKPDESKKQDMPAGAPTGPDQKCKTKVGGTVTAYTATLEYTKPGDKTRDTYDATFLMWLVDGRYYLIDFGSAPMAIRDAAGEPTTPDTPTTPPPDTPTTPPPDTPTTPPDANAAIAELEQLRSAACSCTDKACGDAVDVKLQAAMQRYGDVPAAKPADTDKIRALGNEVAACLKKFATSDGPPPEPGKGLPECEAYARAAERFIKCPKAPKQSREAVQKAVDGIRTTWGDPASMSADTKKSAAETCKTLEKSMKDAAAAMGCK